MARKLIKSMAIAGFILLTTTPLALAGSQVHGLVDNQNNGARFLYNNVTGDRNKADLATISLEGSTVTAGGQVLNRLEGPNRHHLRNLINSGDDNHALLGTVNLKNTTVSGTVQNHYGGRYLQNNINGDRNAAMLGAINAEDSTIAGNVSNTLGPAVPYQMGNIIQGDDNTSVLGSINLENSTVTHSGQVINFLSGQRLQNNINGDRNTSVLGGVSIANSTVTDTMQNSFIANDSSNIVTGDDNHVSMGGVLIE